MMKYILHVSLAEMRRFRRLWHKPLAEYLLIVEATIWLAFASVLVHLVPFRRWALFLGQQNIETSRESLPSTQVTQIRNAIAVVNRVAQGRFTCLMEAVAGKAMLNRRGLENTLYLGVLISNEGGEFGMSAHAWLRCGNAILTGGRVHQQFSVISCFASGSHDK